MAATFRVAKWHPVHCHSCHPKRPYSEHNLSISFKGQVVFPFFFPQDGPVTIQWTRMKTTHKCSFWGIAKQLAKASQLSRFSVQYSNCSSSRFLPPASRYLHINHLAVLGGLSTVVFLRVGMVRSPYLTTRTYRRYIYKCTYIYR